MVILRMRSKEEHKNLLKKVKKMKEFLEDIEDCIEDAEEDDDFGYREHHKEWDDEMDMPGGRYGYRRGGGSRRM